MFCLADKEACTRVNLNIPNGLLKELDDYARQLGLSRTGAACVLIRQSLDSTNGISAISELQKYLEDIKEIVDSK